MGLQVPEAARPTVSVISAIQVQEGFATLLSPVATVAVAMPIARMAQLVLVVIRSAEAQALASATQAVRQLSPRSGRQPVTSLMSSDVRRLV